MTTVQRHIQYLAATTDCVIIPGWGGLIASLVPARISGNRFMPPSRSLVFNPDLTHDDGALASSLCRRQRISYDCARAEIEAEVAAMRNAYEACGSITLPRIGTFRRLADSTMRFEADPNSIAGARFSYLKPVVIAAGAADNTTSLEAEEHNEIHVMPRESLGRKILRVAAFVAILLGLALTLSTPISVNLDRQADFAAVGSCPVAMRQPSASEAKVSLQLTLNVPDPEQSVASVADRPAPKAVEPAKYYLIIGSLDSRTQAERWMSKRPESNLGIIERNGRYRVYAATGATIEEASRLKSDPDFARRNPEAWVYRRR